MKNIEKYKKEISDKYIKEFKEELNFFEKILVSPIVDKMKDVLSSDKEIMVNNLGELEDIGFRRKILGIKILDKKLFGKLTSKVFDFLKKKQKEILIASTSGQLDSLYEEIVNGIKSEDKISKEDNDSSKNQNEEGNNNKEKKEEPDNNNTNRNISIGVGTGIVTGTAGAKVIKSMEKISHSKAEKFLEHDYTYKRSQDILKESSEALELQSKNPNFTPEQQANFKKTATKYRETASSMGDSEMQDLFKQIDNLKGKVGANELAKLNMSPKFQQALLDLKPEDFDELFKLLQQDDISSAKKIFKSSTGLKLPDDVITVMKKTSTLDEVTVLVRRVLPRINPGFKGVCNGLKGVGFLDFAMIGLDVFFLLDTLDEAELMAKRNEVRADNKRNQARAHFGVAIAGLAAEIGLIAICASGGSVGGPVGTLIGLAVGGIAYGVDEALDYYVFDKRDFYSQKEKDYLMQERTQIKQAIYQSAMSQALEKDKSVKTDYEVKGINTFEEAFRAIIMLEELVDYSGNTKLENKQLLYKYVSGDKSKDAFIKSLSGEEKKEFTLDILNLESIIDHRMEYVDKYLESDALENKDLVKNIRNMNGIKYIESVVTDSKMYYEMKLSTNEYMDNKQYNSIEDYNHAYKDKLELDNPTYFKALEGIFNEDIGHFRFREIYYGAESYKSQLETTNKDHKYDKLLENTKFILEYSRWKKLNLSVEEEGHMPYGFNSFDYNRIHGILKDIDKNINKVNSRNNTDIKSYFENPGALGVRKESIGHASDLTSQSVIYRIAREFHGYTGNNDNMELINYFSEKTGDNKGFYYDSGRKLNISGLDRSINFSILDDLILNSDEELSQKSDSLVKSIFYKRIPAQYMKGIETVPGYYKKLKLDSNAEAYDEGLIDEYIDRIAKIVEEELSFSLVGTKKQTEEDIINFIKDNSNQVDVDGDNTTSGDMQGYIQLPHHLVVNAKKTKLGNVENYLFKYENNNIVALTRGQYMDGGLNFDQSNTFIQYESLSPLHESLSTEEQTIINQVDVVQKKLESLRSVTSLSSLEDELNIPIEIEREISSKGLERENIKSSLLYMKPVSSKSILAEKRENYYNYFNSLYLGFLSDINNSTFFNNQSDIGQYNKALRFDIRKIVSIDDKKSLIPQEGLFTKKQNEVFNLLIKNKYGDEEKSIEELSRSEDEIEKKKAIYYSQKIIQSILEAGTLGFDENGNITDINSPVAEMIKKYGGVITLGGFGMLISKGLYSSAGAKLLKLRIEENLSEPYKNYNTVLDSMDIKIEVNEQSIREVSESEVHSYQNTENIQTDIINTENEVDRSGKRRQIKKTEQINENGKISYNIESRDKSTKINKLENAYQIDDLDINFSNEEEVIDIANFINKMKGDQLENHLDHKGLFQFSWTGDLEINDNKYLAFDTTMLKSNTLKSKFPTIVGNAKFIEYLNQL